MYLHIGGNTVVPESEIVGVFDLDNATTARDTRAFLRRAEEEGMVIPTGNELPRTMVLCCPQGSWQRVYITPAGTGAILNRLKNKQEGGSP